MSSQDHPHTSLGAPLHLPSSNSSSWSRRQGCRLCMGHKHELLLTKPDLATHTTNRSIGQQGRPTVSNQYSTISQSSQSNIKCLVDYFGLLPLGKGSFCLYSNRHLVWIGIFLPTHTTLRKPTFVNLENALSTIMLFHTASLINKELILRAHAHRTHRFYYLPHHTEVSVSMKQWNDLLKPQLWF